MAEFPLARDRHQQRDSETNINKFVIITSITLDNYKFLDPPLLREGSLGGYNDKHLLICCFSREKKTVDVCHNNSQGDEHEVFYLLSSFTDK